MKDSKTTKDTGHDTYSTAEMIAAYDVIAFSHGVVVVVRKRDGVEGSLQFEGRPRVYYGFVSHR